MKTLVVVSRKGGAGKTTVAVNLLLAARTAGLKAVLADTDPLRGAGGVLRDRYGSTDVLFETSAPKIFALVQACSHAGVELLIIDTPAAPEADVVEAVKHADLCLAVARPTHLDLAAAASSVAVVQRLGRNGLIVFNQCGPTRNGVEPPGLVRAFAAMRHENLPVASIALRQRVAYQTALSKSRSVLEIEGSDAAACDVRALFCEIWLRLTDVDVKALDAASETLGRARRLWPANAVQPLKFGSQSLRYEAV